MQNIYVVWEDCHGDISYWTDKADAYNEARKVYKSGCEHQTILTDEQIDSAEYGVGVHEQPLNKSWITD